jgi:hypothetical protein
MKDNNKVSIVDERYEEILHRFGKNFMKRFIDIDKFEDFIIELDGIKPHNISWFEKSDFTNKIVVEYLKQTALFVGVDYDEEYIELTKLRVVNILKSKSIEDETRDLEN